MQDLGARLQDALRSSYRIEREFGGGMSRVCASAAEAVRASSAASAGYAAPDSGPQSSPQAEWPRSRSTPSQLMRGTIPAEAVRAPATASAG